MRFTALLAPELGSTSLHWDGKTPMALTAPPETHQHLLARVLGCTDTSPGRISANSSHLRTQQKQPCKEHCNVSASSCCSQGAEKCPAVNTVRSCDIFQPFLNKSSFVLFLQKSFLTALGDVSLSHISKFPFARPEPFPVHPSSARMPCSVTALGGDSPVVTSVPLTQPACAFVPSGATDVQRLFCVHWAGRHEKSQMLRLKKKIEKKEKNNNKNQCPISHLQLQRANEKQWSRAGLGVCAGGNPDLLILV